MPDLRIVLIGCSKTKRKIEYDRSRGGCCLPRELYSGQLFTKRVEYAERNSLPWIVLSAEHGIWKPTHLLKPYEASFADLTPADRAIWPVSVACRLLHELWEPWEEDEAQPVLKPAQLTFEIHAGNDYAHPLAEILQMVGVRVELPCEGLGIGEQLALYTSGALAK